MAYEIFKFSITEEIADAINEGSDPDMTEIMGEIYMGSMGKNPNMTIRDALYYNLYERSGTIDTSLENLYDALPTLSVGDVVHGEEGWFMVDAMGYYEISNKTVEKFVEKFHV